MTETPSGGFIAVGGGVMGAKIHFGKDSYILLMHKPTWAARWSKPRPIIGTEHPGCVDVRLSRCEYDGKLSVAAVNASHFRVYARANMNTHGGRHVVTALCSHHATHACGPFALIQVEGYALRGHNNIYFFCVEVVDGRFVGYAPVVDEGEAYIGLATSADGVSFSKFARVTASERDVEGGKHHYRYRALDQPVCGLQRRDGRTALYVQREVPGIYGEGQDCCHKPITRLEAIDVSRWV